MNSDLVTARQRPAIGMSEGMSKSRRRGDARANGGLNVSPPPCEKGVAAARSSPSLRPPKHDKRPNIGSGFAADTTAPGDNPAGLYRLMTFMSLAYPVGAFAYSSGIEWVVEAGDIRDGITLGDWAGALLRHGSIFCDAVILAAAHRAIAPGDQAGLASIAELAAALAGSKERFLETTSQGQAFLDVTRAAWPAPVLDVLAVIGPLAYPVAVAAACAGHGIAVAPALTAFLHGVVSNLVSAGVRLIPLGQTDGQRVLAALEAPVADVAARALKTPIEEIGTATLRADIASMRHETQYTRLFRS